MILGSNPCGLTFYRLLNTAAIAKSVRSSGDSTRPLLENFQIWTKPLNIAIVVRLL
mgnify:FL=1